jgi:hypothetical protein
MLCLSTITGLKLGRIQKKKGYEKRNDYSAALFRGSFERDSSGCSKNSDSERVSDVHLAV